MKIKGLWDEFSSRHPKFPMFLNAVMQNGITEGTIIEIQIQKPDGKEYTTNHKITNEDLKLFETLKSFH